VENVVVAEILEGGRREVVKMQQLFKKFTGTLHRCKLGFLLNSSPQDWEFHDPCRLFSFSHDHHTVFSYFL